MRPAFLFTAFVALLIQLPAANVRSQDSEPLDFKNLLGVADESPLASSGDIKLSATLTTAEIKTGAEALLRIRAELPTGSYIYSTNPSQFSATKIGLTKVSGLTEVDSEFLADRAPKKAPDPYIGKTLEKFFDHVTWIRRFRFTDDFDPNSVTIEGTVTGTYCSSGPEGLCRPILPPFKFQVQPQVLPPGSPGLMALTAPSQSTPAGTVTPDTQEAPVEPAAPLVFSIQDRPARRIKDKDLPDPVEFRVALQPADARPGDTVKLSITAALDDKWHIFALTQDPEMAGLPTELDVQNLTGMEPADGAFFPSHEAEVEKPLDDIIQHVHYGEITWSRDYRVTQVGAGGQYGLDVSVSYQVCKNVCKPPRTVSYSLGHVVESAQLATTGVPQTFDFQETPQATTLQANLLFAFLGGLLLNVMPCVLPVLAIKILSFVQQAGESRGKILVLNCAYSVGVISVFLVLAGLAVSVGMGWGQQFQNDGFNVVMACVVFVMGLSLLGVFELPVPGMIGSSAGAQQKEGPAGAFMTGVFATLLATPCTGPFMGVTLAWSVTQPAPIVFLVWGTLGLGMASPYLLIAMFPSLVRLLPKPGMWMVYFKEFSGLVLMGTVIWLLNPLDEELLLPTLIILLGLAVGVWVVGRFHNAALSRWSRHAWIVRGSATILGGLICWLGLSYYSDGLRLAEIRRETGVAGGPVRLHENELAWEPFSDERLEQLLVAGQPTLVDFTADWCAICKQNEKIALNTKETVEFVEAHNFTPLYADYTDYDPSITKWLNRFGQDGVPLTIIFPAGQPDRPIPLRAGFSQATLLKKLRQAVADSATPNQQQAQQTASTDIR